MVLLIVDIPIKWAISYAGTDRLVDFCQILKKGQSIAAVKLINKVKARINKGLYTVGSRLILKVILWILATDIIGMLTAEEEDIKHLADVLEYDEADIKIPAVGTPVPSEDRPESTDLVSNESYFNLIDQDPENINKPENVNNFSISDASDDAKGSIKSNPESRSSEKQESKNDDVSSEYYALNEKSEM